MDIMMMGVVMMFVLMTVVVVAIIVRVIMDIIVGMSMTMTVAMTVMGVPKCQHADKIDGKTESAHYQELTESLHMRAFGEPLERLIYNLNTYKPANCQHQHSLNC